MEITALWAGTGGWPSEVTVVAVAAPAPDMLLNVYWDDLLVGMVATYAGGWHAAAVMADGSYSEHDLSWPEAAVTWVLDTTDIAP